MNKNVTLAHPHLSTLVYFFFPLVVIPPRLLFIFRFIFLLSIRISVAWRF